MTAPRHETPATSPIAASAPRPAAPAGMRAIPALVLSLSLTSARNRWRRRLTRLRRPRYVIALLAGAAYLYFIIFRQSASASMGAIIVPWAETLTALGFTLLAASWWLTPTQSAALAFTPQEAYLLFPAPVPRRALLLWKVLRAQGAILFSTILWIALLRGGATTGGWLRALALWALFSTTHLHRLAVQLAHAARRERADGRPERGVVAPVVLTTLLIAIVSSLWGARETFDVARSSAELGEAVGAALDAGPARWALAPARAAVAPLFATAVAEWLPRVALALGVLAAHYAWVLGRDVPFEESALAASTLLADRVLASQRRRGRARPVAAKGRWISRRLRATGAASTAVAWKNILGWVRSSRPGPVLIGALVFGVINVLISGGELTIADLMMPMAIAFGLLLVLFGPGVVRADLRQDLAMLEIVRGWPLAGRAIFGAEVAGGAMLLLLLQLAYVGIVGGAFMLAGTLTFTPRDALAWAASLVVGLGVLDYAHVTLYNLMAVLFPDWVRPDRERMGGVEATGQGMLLFISLLLALSLLLVLPLAAFGAGAYLAASALYGGMQDAALTRLDFWLEVGAAPAFAGIAAAALVLLLETQGLVWWGGRALDRMEPPDAK